MEQIDSKFICVAACFVYVAMVTTLFTLPLISLSVCDVQVRASGTLVIMGATPTNNGVYTCVLMSGGDLVANASAIVTVHGKKGREEERRRSGGVEEWRSGRVEEGRY